MLTFLLCLSLIQGFAQLGFRSRRQKLTTHFIDTTNERVFVYETKNAVLYFKQTDISALLAGLKAKNLLRKYYTATLQDTLKANTQMIRVKDIYYGYSDKQLDSILRHKPQIGKSDKLNEEFYSIGAILILDGKFMIYSKDRMALVTKGLVAKKEKGLIGARTLGFYLPD